MSQILDYVADALVDVATCPGDCIGALLQGHGGARSFVEGTEMNSGIKNLTATALILAGLCSVNVVHANELKNSSFEKPPASNGGFIEIPTGNSFSGWRVVGEPGTVALINENYSAHGYSFPARKGKQWIDLTGTSHGETGVQQKLDTVPGQTYSLTFFVGNVHEEGGSLGMSSTVNVIVDGKQLLSAHNKKGNGTTIAWKRFVTTFLATKDKTAISFMNGDGDGDDLNGLDAVTVVPVGGAPPSVGLIINEVMANPAGVVDSAGEWFELVNTTDDAQNLKGMVIATSSSSHVISQDVTVPPDGFVVLGINSDEAVNGGVPVDYVYSGIVLPNSGGALTISYDGAVLDAVDFAGLTWPSGRSFQLDPDHQSVADNDDLANWCFSNSPYSETDTGTPGQANGHCQ